MDENHTIWIEKYRPAHLAGIVGQDEIVERLSSYVRTKTSRTSSSPEVPASARQPLPSRSRGSSLATRGR